MEMFAFIAGGLSVACLGLALAFRQSGVARPADLVTGAAGYFRPAGLALWRLAAVLGALAVVLLAVDVVVELEGRDLAVGLLGLAVAAAILAWLYVRRPGRTGARR